MERVPDNRDNLSIKPFKSLDLACETKWSIFADSHELIFPILRLLALRTSIKQLMEKSDYGS